MANCDGCDKGAEYCMNCNRRFERAERERLQHNKVINAFTKVVEALITAECSESENNNG